MVDGKENYKFDLGVKGSSKCSINPFTGLICLYFANQSFNFLTKHPSLYYAPHPPFQCKNSSLLQAFPFLSYLSFHPHSELGFSDKPTSLYILIPLRLNPSRF